MILPGVGDPASLGGFRLPALGLYATACCGFFIFHGLEYLFGIGIAHARSLFVGFLLLLLVVLPLRLLVLILVFIVLVLVLS